MEDVAAVDAVGRDLADPVSFRQFCERTLPRVYGYLLVRAAGGRVIAEDLTQETFLAAVGEIRRGAVIDDPERWVMGIARHKLLDHYRRRRREERTLVFAST